MKKGLVALIAAAMLLTLSGCFGAKNTVQTFVVCGEAFAQKEALEAAEQPEGLAKNSAVYAVAHVVESPRGMEYTAKWYLNGAKIKEETMATRGDTQDILSFELEPEKAAAGTLRAEILWHDTVLAAKELTIE